MSEAEKNARAKMAALGEKISNETMVGVQGSIEKNGVVDLNKNQAYQNIVNGLQPKDIALRDTTRNISGINAFSSKYLTDISIKSDEVAYYSPESVYKRVFADDIAKGMAMHAGGVRNRPQMRVDFTEVNILASSAPLNNTGRKEGVIYVTQRDAMSPFPSPKHLAIEYRDETGIRWISSAPYEGEGRFDISEGFTRNYSGVGFVSNEQINNPNYTVDAYSGDRKRDFPTSNETLTELLPPKGMTSKEYFEELIDAESNFRTQQIDYDLFPSQSDGYNSNSFVHGIIQATGGQPRGNLNIFVGGNKPILAEYFYNKEKN